MRAPGAGEPRITLTLPLIVAAGRIYLHIEGAEKAATLAAALQDGPVEDTPLRGVLRRRAGDVFLWPCADGTGRTFRKMATSNLRTGRRVQITTQHDSAQPVNDSLLAAN